MQDQEHDKQSSVRPPPLPTPVQPLAAYPLSLENAPQRPLDYYGPDQALMSGSGPWVMLGRFQSSNKWHAARAALLRGHIPALMGEGEDVPNEQSGLAGDGIALLVRRADLPRASAILQAMESGSEWCPQCASTSLRKLPLPWWWIAWSILFLGVAPFAPHRFQCQSCGHRWE